MPILAGLISAPDNGMPGFKFIKVIHLTVFLSLAIHAGLLYRIGAQDSFGQQTRAAARSVVSLQARLVSTPEPTSTPTPDQARPVPARRTSASRHASNQATHTTPERSPTGRHKTARQDNPTTPNRKADQTAANKSLPGALARQSGIGSIVRLQQDYSRELLARIQRHKTYPRSAQRRRISGRVTLSLQLDRQGRIVDLHCTGNPMLCRAAMRATRSAAPFQPLPAGTARLAFDYQMSYILK